MNSNTPFFDRLDEYRATPQPPSDWRAPEETESDTPAVPPAVIEQNGEELRSAYSRVGLGLFLYAVIPQVLAIGFSFLGALAFPHLMNEAWFQLLLSDALMYLIGAPICLLAMGMPKRKSAVAPEGLPILVFLAGVCIFEFASIIGNIVGMGLMDLLSTVTKYDYNSTLDSMMNALPLPMIFIFVVILGPIMEELIFRKAPLDRLLPYGEFRAVFMTSIIFGLAHANFFQFFYCVAGGMVMGYLYARTRRIVYPILLHIIFNFMGGFVPVFLERATGINSNMTEEELLAANPLGMLVISLYSLFTYALALAGLIAFCLLIKQIKFRKAELPLPEKGLARRTWLNGGMIALLIASVLFLALSLIPVPAA